MATTDTATIGITNGGTRTCTSCGGLLHVVDGSDPLDAADGFEETYECRSCGAIGGLEYHTETNTTTYTGACANYHNQ